MAGLIGLDKDYSAYDKNDNPIHEIDPVTSLDDVLKMDDISITRFCLNDKWWDKNYEEYSKRKGI